MSTRTKVIVTVAALTAVTWWAVTTKNVAGPVVVGLLINEFGELSPWLARHLVNWAAYRWTTDPHDAADLSREWQGIIDQRPGKLFKLFTALGFASSAGAGAARSALSRFWHNRFVRRVALGLAAAGALVYAVDLIPAGTVSPALIPLVMDVLLFISVATGTLMLIIGGIKYTVSGGDSGAVASAKNTIAYAVVGMVVSIAAYAIVNVVTKQLVS